MSPRFDARMRVAMLACLGFGAVACPPDPAPPAQASERQKGLFPHLFVVRKGDGALEPLYDGAPVGHGDLVQVGYVAAGHAHGVIVSIDGRGHVTLHHPSTAGEPPVLIPRGRHPLPYAFELDDAQAFERFVFVATDTDPLDPQLVLDAAGAIASFGEAAATVPLPLPSTWHQSSLLLRKIP